jgi:hypothetical protein
MPPLRTERAVKQKQKDRRRRKTLNYGSSRAAHLTTAQGMSAIQPRHPLRER